MLHTFNGVLSTFVLHYNAEITTDKLFFTESIDSNENYNNLYC